MGEDNNSRTIILLLWTILFILVAGKANAPPDLRQDSLSSLTSVIIK